MSMSNDKTKRVVLGAAAVAVVLGTLYSLALRVPSSRSQAAAGAAEALTAQRQSATAEQATMRAAAQSLALSGAQSVAPGEQASGDSQLGDPEQIAIANARKPIEEQTPDVQQRYYEGWLIGLRHAQALQRNSLLRLEQQQQEASDSQTRTLLEQQIAQRRKLIDERGEQIARYESKVIPTGP
jgi:hypothetical protein